MKQTALTAPPNPAREKTTWGDVCRQVGFADNLYRTCRDKLGNDFSPHSPFGDIGSAYDMDFEDVDIDRQLRGQALAIPPPPDEDGSEELGFFEQLMDGSITNKVMVYGGGALVLWYLYDKFLRDKPVSAPAQKPALSAVPSPARSAPARSIPAGQVSDTAPTTVDIPASLRG